MSPLQDCPSLYREGCILLEKGRYRVRIAAGQSDLRAAQALRSQCFATPELDQDDFDQICLQVLIEDCGSGDLVGCFRLLLLAAAGGMDQSYSAQFYDLSNLNALAGAKLELGRFCIAPDHQDPDVLRMAWGAVTRIVDDQNIGFLFGCSSFAGPDPQPYLEAISLLHYRYLAPTRLRPEGRAPLVHAFSDLLSQRGNKQKPDLKKAQTQLPPLLRGYLAMGGWVGDQLVIDRDLGTCHVFTGLQVADIPPRRQAQLRAVAAPH